jgi:hypothetical protein
VQRLRAPCARTPRAFTQRIAGTFAKGFRWVGLLIAVTTKPTHYFIPMVRIWLRSSSYKYTFALGAGAAAHR